jgi:hypothetical protein
MKCIKIFSKFKGLFYSSFQWTLSPSSGRKIPTNSMFDLNIEQKSNIFIYKIKWHILLYPNNGSYRWSQRLQELIHWKKRYHTKPKRVSYPVRNSKKVSRIATNSKPFWRFRKYSVVFEIMNTPIKNLQYASINVWFSKFI